MGDFSGIFLCITINHTNQHKHKKWNNREYIYVFREWVANKKPLYQRHIQCVSTNAEAENLPLQYLLSVTVTISTVTSYLFG